MSVHNDTIQGLREALEYVKGNIQLKTTFVEIPGDDRGGIEEAGPNNEGAEVFGKAAVM
jgi:hypothetical protein